MVKMTRPLLATDEPADDEWVGLAEAARRLKIHPNTLRKAVKRSRLGPVQTIGKRTNLVRWGDVKRYKVTVSEVRKQGQRVRRERERAERVAALEALEAEAALRQAQAAAQHELNEQRMRGLLELQRQHGVLGTPSLEPDDPDDPASDPVRGPQEVGAHE